MMVGWENSSMSRRWIAMIGVVAVVLSGCTKCGPIWDDWLQSPKSCRSDHFIAALGCPDAAMI
jgi:hypothetical protein